MRIFICLLWVSSSWIVMAQDLTITTQPTDQQVCAGLNSLLAVEASSSSPISYQWYIKTEDTENPYLALVDNGGYSNTQTSSLTIYTLGSFGAGIYHCQITSGASMLTTDDVSVTVNASPAKPSVAGGQICGTGSVIMNASGATDGLYRWYTTDEDGAQPTPGAQNAAYASPTISKSTTYYVTVTNGTCESARAAVGAVINPLPLAPVANDVSGCGSMSLTLSASGSQNGNYRWYTTAQNGSPIAGEFSSTYTTPTLTNSVTDYYVSIHNGTCEGLRTKISARIDVPIQAPSVTGDSVCGQGQLTLKASGGTDGKYRWYTSDTNGEALAGQVNGTLVTRMLASSVTYYVSSTNGVCESARVPVIAKVFSIPSMAITTGASVTCGPASLTLKASGGEEGQYRWYTSDMNPIPGQVASTFKTPSINTTSTYYVAINNGFCESAKAIVIATIDKCPEEKPVFSKSFVPNVQMVNGKVQIDLTTMIENYDQTIDFKSLRVAASPKSGAFASIDDHSVLEVDYTNVDFAGTEKLSIEVCSIYKSCTTNEISYDVAGDIVAYEGISPNGDGLNDVWRIKFINDIEQTKKNHVIIFNRWGDVVFDMTDYDNDSRVFSGLNTNGVKIPSGIYFYKISFIDHEPVVGYVTLKQD